MGIKTELGIIPMYFSFHSHRVDFQGMKVFPGFLVAEWRQSSNFKTVREGETHAI
jgi:hypothetical protein